MFDDLAEIIVRLFGGFWKYRSRLTNLRSGLLRSICRQIYYLYQRRYGCFISHAARIASEPCFPHNLHGIFVAGGARIGHNCVIFQQVTIGANPMLGSRSIGTPQLGDNVYIGAGAMIIGGIKVGNNCRIGANCTVFSDVPDNTVVLTVAPRMVTKDENLLNRYYRWSPDGPLYFERGNWVRETNIETVKALRDAL